MPETPEVKYFVLTDGTSPYLLARVRWPDVAQAVTAGCPDWRSDPGLFDLPADPASVRVSADEAVAIAAAWGVHLSSEETIETSGLSMIRRMPANWSNLAPAEIRAWGLEDVDTTRRVGVDGDARRSRGRHAASGLLFRRWRSWRHERMVPPARAERAETARRDDVARVPAATPVPAPDWDLVIESIASIAGPAAPGKGPRMNGRLPASARRAVIQAPQVWDGSTGTIGRTRISVALDRADDGVALGPAFEARPHVDPDAELDADGGTEIDVDLGVTAGNMTGGQSSELNSS